MRYPSWWTVRSSSVGGSAASNVHSNATGSTSFASSANRDDAHRLEHLVADRPDVRVLRIASRARGSPAPSTAPCPATPRAYASITLRFVYLPRPKPSWSEPSRAIAIAQTFSVHAGSLGPTDGERVRDLVVEALVGGDDRPDRVHHRHATSVPVGAVEQRLERAPVQDQVVGVLGHLLVAEVDAAPRSRASSRSPWRSAP